MKAPVTAEREGPTTQFENNDERAREAKLKERRGKEKEGEDTRRECWVV